MRASDAGKVSQPVQAKRAGAGEPVQANRTVSRLSQQFSTTGKHTGSGTWRKSQRDSEKYIILVL